MKFSCILLSLALVNVLEASFRDSVSKSNRFIEFIRRQRTNVLPFIIINAINGAYTMEQIAYMFAVPAYSDGTLQCMIIHEQIEVALRREIQTEFKRDILDTELIPDQPDESLERLEEIRKGYIEEVLGSLVEDYITRDNHVVMSKTICHLIGLVYSVKEPTFIISADISNNICKLTPLRGVIQEYGIVSEKIWVLNGVDSVQFTKDCYMRPNLLTFL